MISYVMSSSYNLLNRPQIIQVCILILKVYSIKPALVTLLSNNLYYVTLGLFSLHSVFRINQICI